MVLASLRLWSLLAVATSLVVHTTGKRKKLVRPSTQRDITNHNNEKVGVRSKGCRTRVLSCY
jgi:hypothetical protein